RFKNDVATIPARLTSGWLARLCREGVDPLDRCQRFQVIHPPFLDLAWRKGSFILNLPLWFRSFNHLVGARKQRWRQLEAERALALLRLIVRSILVGNSIGKSPALAPLRIRST